MPVDARTQRLRRLEAVHEKLSSKFPLPGLEEARLIRNALRETVQVLAEEIAISPGEA